MSNQPWHTQKRHYRDLKVRLEAEGFKILDVWANKHTRIQVERNNRKFTITLGNTPSVPEYAIVNAMQQARRGTL